MGGVICEKEVLWKRGPLYSVHKLFLRSAEVCKNPFIEIIDQLMIFCIQ